MSLRTKVVHLAAQNPAMRAHLLPLIVASGLMHEVRVRVKFEKAKVEGYRSKVMVGVVSATLFLDSETPWTTNRQVALSAEWCAQVDKATRQAWTRSYKAARALGFDAKGVGATDVCEQFRDFRQGERVEVTLMSMHVSNVSEASAQSALAAQWQQAMAVYAGVPNIRLVG
jgi:hypothetical protein